MNIRTASLLTALLFLAAPLALVPSAVAQDPTCVPDTELCVPPEGDFPPTLPACDAEFSNVPCMPSGLPPAGEGACAGPANLPTDPVFTVMCTVASSAGGLPTDDDVDQDGRPDLYQIVLPVGGSLAPDFVSDAVLGEGNLIGDCPEGTTPVGDKGVTDFFGDVFCAGPTPLFVQADFFFTDANPATPDEWYGLAGPSPADVAVDVMVYNPQTGEMVRDGNGQRLSTVFAHGADARFGPAAYVLALYAPDAGAADGGNCLVCVQMGATGPARVVYGFGSTEGIIDLAPQPGDDYLNQWDHRASTLVIGAPGGPNGAPSVNAPGITFADGKGFLLDAIHVKVGDPRLSDVDDDGFTDLDEVLCTSNPTNGESTCYDLDGDRLEYTPGGDNDKYVNADSDKDGILSSSDNCPTTFNPLQENRDGDSQGDACDADDDNDAITDGADSCNSATSAIGPFGDHDGDGCHDDLEDTDDDRDGVADASDRDPTSGKDCSRGALGTGSDLDGDGCKDSEDPDQDNDTVPDAADNCDRNANLDQKDDTETAVGGEADGVGNVCDGDKDGDGVPATVPTGTPAGNDPTAGDCNDNNPDVGAPTLGLCQVDGAAGPVSGVVDTVVQTVEDLIDGGAPSPGILVPLLLYPECSSDAPSERCDDDPFDVRDARDFDGDGNRDESSGQMDIVEERVYYQGTDGLLDLVVLQPSPAFGPLPGTAVRLTVFDPSELGPVVAIIEQRVAPAQAGLAAFYCIHEHGTTQLTVGAGATVEAACASPYDFTAGANAVGAQAGSTIAGQLMTVPAQPLFTLTDTNADGLPDALVLVAPDPASCAPTGSGPGTRIKCSAYGAPTTVPLAGVPSVGPEALCPVDFVGVFPFCEAEPAPDADGDGVADEADECPGTPEGTAVGEDGCPADPEPVDPCDPAANEAFPEGCEPGTPGLPCDPEAAEFPLNCLGGDDPLAAVCGEVPDLPVCGDAPVPCDPASADFPFDCLGADPLGAVCEGVPDLPVCGEVPGEPPADPSELCAVPGVGDVLAALEQCGPAEPDPCDTEPAPEECEPSGGDPTDPSTIGCDPTGMQLICVDDHPYGIGKLLGLPFGVHITIGVPGNNPIQFHI